MNKTLAISAIALIAVMMVVGTVSPTVFADKPEEKKNNGGNGCEKSGNVKACENNPNTTPVEELTCQDCWDNYWDAAIACGEGNYDCVSTAYGILKECLAKMLESTGEHCPDDPRGR